MSERSWEREGDVTRLMIDRLVELAARVVVSLPNGGVGVSVPQNPNQDDEWGGGPDKRDQFDVGYNRSSPFGGSPTRGFHRLPYKIWFRLAGWGPLPHRCSVPQKPPYGYTLTLGMPSTWAYSANVVSSDKTLTQPLHILTQRPPPHHLPLSPPVVLPSQQ
jgi:hypothetical protein